MLSVEIIGGERLEAALQGAARDVEDLRPAWRPFSDEVFSIVRQQFLSQGARGPAGKWTPRSPKYVAAQTATNRGGFRVLNEPMRQTDALFKAVTTRGAPHGIYEEQPDSLTLGTTLPYAAIHQRGGRNMPQRKIYDLTDRDVKKLLDILKRALVTKLEDRGFDFVDAGEIPF